MYTYIPSLLKLPSPPSPTPLGHHSTELSFLCQHSRFPPASCFTHSDAYLSTLLPQFAPPSPSPAVSACLFSMSAPLFLPCKYSPGELPDPEIEPGSPTFQADALLPEPQGKPLCIYTLIYNICFFNSSSFHS